MDEELYTRVRRASGQPADAAGYAAASGVIRHLESIK